MICPSKLRRDDSSAMKRTVYAIEDVCVSLYMGQLALLIGALFVTRNFKAPRGLHKKQLQLPVGMSQSRTTSDTSLTIQSYGWNDTGSRHHRWFRCHNMSEEGLSESWSLPPCLCLFLFLRSAGDITRIHTRARPTQSTDAVSTSWSMTRHNRHPRHKAKPNKTTRKRRVRRTRYQRRPTPQHCRKPSSLVATRLPALRRQQAVPRPKTHQRSKILLF